MLLGDPHNFGKCVRLENNVVFKPRNCFFEALFLDTESPLRKYKPINHLFKNFLSLSYNLNTDVWKDSSVEFAHLTDIHIQEEKTSEIGEAVGSLAALTLFFGLTDLHSTNIFMGKDQSGRLILSPIDIECILAPIKIVSQSHLFYSAKLPREFAGLEKLKILLGDRSSSIIPHAIYAFMCAMDTLIDHRDFILGLFDDKVRSLPIRVIVNATKVYQDILQNNKDHNLSDEETTQLSRNDIPYFFCNLEKENVLYFKDKDQVAVCSSFFASQLLMYPRISVLMRQKEGPHKLAPIVAEIANFFRLKRSESFRKDDIIFTDSINEYVVELKELRIKCV